MALFATLSNDIPFTAFDTAISRDLTCAVIRLDTARPAASSAPEFTRRPEESRAMLASVSRSDFCANPDANSAPLFVLTEVIKTSLKIFFCTKTLKTVYFSIFYSFFLFLAYILLCPKITLDMVVSTFGNYHASIEVAPVIHQRMTKKTMQQCLTLAMPIAKSHIISD